MSREDLEHLVESIRAKNQPPACLVCGEPTRVVFNVGLQKKPICDHCALSIARQLLSALRVVTDAETGATTIMERDR